VFFAVDRAKHGPGRVSGTENAVPAPALGQDISTGKKHVGRLSRKFFAESRSH